MKRCSYCGTEHADNVTVCPLDGQPVVSQKELLKAPAPPPTAAKNAFDVKLISPISSAGTYRAFVERGDLIFIQLDGGPKSTLAALAPLFGPLGNLVPMTLWLFSKKKAKERQEKTNQQNPEDLLYENEGGFKLSTAEIRAAAIEPLGFIATSGQGGRLNLVVRHGEKIKFEFATVPDVNNAIRLLVPLLHSTLLINVEWNSEEQKFERKKRI